MKTTNTLPTKKILIVRFGSLGDIVHGLPAAGELDRRYAGARIDWLCERPYQELLESVPFISRVWGADTKKWRKSISGLRSYSRLVKKLREETFDLVYDFQGLMKSALTARLAKGGETIGFDKAQLREKPSRFFYDRPVTIAPGKRHQVEYALDLVSPPRFMGRASARISFKYSTECLNYLKHHLARNKILEPPVLLNPGAAWETKRWELERFVKLGELLQKTGFPVIWTIGPGEEKLLEKARRLSTVPVVSFPTSILQLSALCSRSRLMVAGDTGPLHLAVASGTPTVAILGPALPWRTGPFHPDDEIVMHQKTCPRPYSRTCKDHFCMDISVEDVFTASLRRLEKEDGKDPSHT